ALGVELLDGAHSDLAALQSGDAVGGGAGSGAGSESRDAVSHSSPADCLLVEPRVLSLRRIDDELDASAFDEIYGVGTCFFHFVSALHFQAGVLEDIGAAVSSDQFEAEIGEAAAEFCEMVLVTIGNTDEDRSGARQ